MQGADLLIRSLKFLLTSWSAPCMAALPPELQPPRPGIYTHYEIIHACISSCLKILVQVDFEAVVKVELTHQG